MSVRRPYEILDVFTESAFAGNPLAVVYKADDLDAAAMQTIAGEFNLSETVFVQRPSVATHSARVRIFTPAMELPFAGHPTVGVAVALARRDACYARNVSQMIVLEEPVGLVRCGITAAGDGADFAEFDLPRAPALAETAPARDAVAAALGLEPHELGFGRFPVSVASAGVAFTMVPVNGIGAIRRATPVHPAWENAFLHEHSQAFLFTNETERPGATFHARMFAPTMGIAEDPATGSAVAALAAVLERYGDFADGEHRLAIEQGIEMGRPSLIHLELSIEDGSLSTARLGGHAVIVARGELLA